MSEEIMRALGQIEGKVDGIQRTQKQHGTKLDGMDTRLHKVENKTILHGTVGGTMAGLGVSLLAAKIKSVLGV